MNAPLSAALNAVLPAIPLVDVRDGGPLRHALENPAKARRCAMLSRLLAARRSSAGAVLRPDFATLARALALALCG